MLFDASKTAGLMALLAGAAQAQYVLDSFFDANNFFNEFSFFTAPDPTHGFVQYVDHDTAFNMGLASTDNGVVRLGADSTEVNPANGRKSTRVSSNKAWTHGLFIGDIAHMPEAHCGSWPAFWTVSEDGWPANGEVDIIEGVNTQTADSVTLHTTEGCVITNDGTAPGTVLNDPNCNAGNGYTGCGQSTSNTLNYGDGFNSVNGGIYAMEWTSNYIAVWFFPRDSIPGDITAGTPNPANWGAPQAKFNGNNGCNIDDHFRNHKVIINTTFCGDWAGSPDVWGNNPTCSAMASSCADFVSNNPQEYAGAFWTINSVSVYTLPAGVASTTFHGSNSTTPSNSTLSTRAFRA